MNKKTLTALKRSIAHWERLANGKRRAYEDIGPEDCALCDLFLHKECEGCPVFGKTLVRGCNGTPYSHAHFVIMNSKMDDPFDDPLFRRAAKTELRFLKSLLPKNKK